MKDNVRAHVAAQYFLNHALEADELRRQISMLAQAGYEVVYAHARAGLETPYFSRKWHDAIGVIIEQCQKEGIQFAIWDEDGYPSPVAGNRIIWAHPELHSRELKFFSQKYSAGAHCHWRLSCDGALLRVFAIADSGEMVDITEFSGTLRGDCSRRQQISCGYSPVGKIPAPHWRTWCEEKMAAIDWKLPADGREYTILAVAVVTSESRHNSDILNRRTTEFFLECTHEEYLERFPEVFANGGVHSSFMDEPAPGGMMPWTGEFAAEFKKMHGFELPDHLAHLAMDIDERSVFIRQCYRETQAKMQCDNYMEPMRQWCADHHIAVVGHLSRTECVSYAAAQWPNELRCCKYLDIPCTDPLGFYIALPESSAYHTGCKVVSSAARLFGKKQCGSDAFAVMGSEAAIRDLDFSLNFQLAMGITFFNIHNLAYSLDGFRKDEAPPSLFYQHTEWPHMRFWLKSLKEKCRQLEEGTPIRRILLLYPSVTLGVNFLPELPDLANEEKLHLFSEELLKRQKDFDFIDEITLAEKVEDIDALRRDYDVLILFSLAYIKKSTAASVEQFRRNGGNIAIIDRVPKLLDHLDCPQIPWSGVECITPDEAWFAALPGVKMEGENCEDILLHSRKLAENRERHFVFNRSNRRDFAGKVAGKNVRVAPGSAIFIEGKNVVSMLVRHETILRPDELVFSENLLPLSVWSYQGGLYHLLDREFFVFEKKGDCAEAVFLWDGGMPSSLEIVWESAAFGDDFELMLNDVFLTNPMGKNVRDCKNITSNIADELHHGNYPMRNVLQLRARKDGVVMPELPLLYGKFQAFFPHGGVIQPLLSPSDGIFHPTGMVDWRTLGFGTFSGQATYSFTFEIDQFGSYGLAWEGLYDSAEIMLDGESKSCVWHRCGSCLLGGLAPGRHRLQWVVANSPGNCDRAAGLPAGLTGELRLQQF